ncbi:extracellular tyrosine-protein kinase PKDCC-like isoform X2 [Xenia sp. Carnegie-2017]|uniref:extracellular tyrosine-protein kinase PKDCC-like isoform X2 n=1 Tax=Xenia sp. Carnegie-2017 TaxID=2897299 RepID=UPI001F048410|nr:extracellular tyrosine-protein kinase PKDCC-like isoform X2 [Xenia sp. Carnegie-2017]
MQPHVRSQWKQNTRCYVSFLLCIVISLYFTFVFLSSYYLDERYTLKCLDDILVNDGTLLKSNEEFHLRKYGLREIITENALLKKILGSVLKNPSSAYRTDVTGQLNSLNYLSRKLENIMDVDYGLKSEKDRNLPNSDSLKLNLIMNGVRAWQERGLSDEGLPDTLGCQEISQIIIQEELGRGYTKRTQRGLYHNREVAVKSVALDSTDVHNCMKKKRTKLVSDCLLLSRYKVMKELLLYQQLKHSNVIKLLGYCFQNDQDTGNVKTRGLTVVTELGTPLNLMTILQMAWHERFRIAVGLARLLKYFSESPLGSLVIRDFQLIQFVTVNGDVKISDLDDVTNEGIRCKSNSDCVIGSKTKNISLSCINNTCAGYNERWNLYNLERFYLKEFLQIGAPQGVFEDLQKIKKKSASFMYDASTLLSDLEYLLRKLRNGFGLEKYRPRNKYRAIAHADFPGFHDYECDYSLSFVNCQMLVYDEVGAMKECDNDVHCRSFVMSYEKSWIGYKWAFFKNNLTNIVSSPDNMVYVKVT